MIKRWELFGSDMSGNTDGEWCKYADVAILEAQFQEAQVRITELEDTWQKFVCGEAEHQEKVCIAECHDQKHGYCYDMQRCSQLEAENAGLRADNAAMVDQMKNIWLKRLFSWLDGKEDGNKILDYLGESMNDFAYKRHPGAALLQELEALRTVNKQFAEILGDMVDVAEVTGSAYLYRRDVGPIKEILAAAKGAD